MVAQKAACASGLFPKNLFWCVSRLAFASSSQVKVSRDWHVKPVSDGPLRPTCWYLQQIPINATNSPKQVASVRHVTDVCPSGSDRRWRSDGRRWADPADEYRFGGWSSLDPGRSEPSIRSKQTLYTSRVVVINCAGSRDENKCSCEQHSSRKERGWSPSPAPCGRQAGY